jgi:hypothetical protein
LLVFIKLFLELAVSFATIERLRFTDTKRIGNKISVEFKTKENDSFAEDLQQDSGEGQYEKKPFQG